MRLLWILAFSQLIQNGEFYWDFVYLLPQHINFGKADLVIGPLAPYELFIFSYCSSSPFSSSFTYCRLTCRPILCLYIMVSVQWKTLLMIMVMLPCFILSYNVTLSFATLPVLPCLISSPFLSNFTQSYVSHHVILNSDLHKYLNTIQYNTMGRSAHNLTVRLIWTQLLWS